MTRKVLEEYRQKIGPAGKREIDLHMHYANSVKDFQRT